MNQTETDRIPTGFRGLDATLGGGLKRGELAVLASRTSVGKFALALNIAVNVAKAGNPATFFSAEMPTDRLGDRLVYRESRVSLDHRRSLALREEDLLAAGADRLRQLPLVLRFRPTWRPREIKAESQMLRAQWGDPCPSHHRLPRVNGLGH